MTLIVKIDDYAVVTPCKPLGDNRWLMVTAWPSRKATRHYLGE